MIINKGNLQTLFRAFKGNFKRGLMSRQDTAEWQQLATMVPSSTTTEEYGWLGQFPSMREWIGDRHVKNLEQHDYSIKNKPYESTVAVPRTDIEDDKEGLYAPIFEDMGVAAALWPNEIVYELIKNGESETAYDGKSFFATDHPENGSTASNLLGSGSTPWYLIDNSRALKPFIFQRRQPPEFVSLTNPEQGGPAFWEDRFVYGARSRGAAGFGFWQMAIKSKNALTETNFDDAVAEMGKRVNDEGRTLGLRPKLLVVPWSLRADAKALIEVDRLSSGATNKNFQAVDVLVSPYLPNS